MEWEARSDLKEETRKGGSEDEAILCASVLLVEDDAAVRSLTRDLLIFSGHEVLEAQSRAHAIEIFQQRDGRIDLLITDVVMPDMSGPKLAEHLRSLYADIKILFISGYMDESLR